MKVFIKVLLAVVKEWKNIESRHSEPWFYIWWLKTMAMIEEKAKAAI